MKITGIGIKEEGRPYRMNSPNFFQKQLDELPPGKYQHTVEKYRLKATPAQFGYLYKIVYPMSLIALNNAGYEFTTIEECDQFWKSMFCAKDVLNRETGEIMKIPMTKSEFLTVDEMTYCNAIRNYVSEYLGVSIPDPDPRWKRNE
jgi:hypothetical protein